MSLAMFAAPVENNEDDDNNVINQRKRHNKTQKKYETPKPSPSSSNKVNSVLATIQESMSTLDDSESNMGDFNPPPPPVSIGASRTKQNQNPEPFENGNTLKRENPIVDRFRTIGNQQASYNQGSNLDLNYLDSNYIDNRAANDYYSKFLPSISAGNSQTNRIELNKRFQNSLHKMNQTSYDNAADFPSHDVLMQKINYMINLLEEQQDERVGNVGEEVVLYSFLGIFMIFLVDSFVRVGKYVR